MRASANAKAAQHARSALIEHYPEIKCKAMGGYETGVCLRIIGAVEQTKQGELKEWLMRWKEDNEINAPVWVQFEADERLLDYNGFDFARPNTFKL